MDCKKIGKYIKEKRKALGYKQSDLGEMLSVSDKAVSKWECGVALPDVALLPELSKILNVDISEILNGEDDPKVEEEIKKKNKSKICIITLSILSSVLFILVIILGIYFINNYDRVHVYKLVGEKDGFYVTGNLISIGDKKYLSLSEFVYDGNSEKFLYTEIISYDVFYSNKLIYSQNDKCFSDLTNCFSNKIMFIAYNCDLKLNDDDYFVVIIKFRTADNIYNEFSLKLKIYE